MTPSMSQNRRVGIPIGVVHVNRVEAAKAVGQFTRWRCAGELRNMNSNQSCKASGTNFEREEAPMTNVQKK